MHRSAKQLYIYYNKQAEILPGMSRLNMFLRQSVWAVILFEQAKQSKKNEF